MILMVDLKTQYHQLQEQINKAVLDVLEDSRYILGPNVSAFEKESAEFLGYPMRLVVPPEPMPYI